MIAERSGKLGKSSVEVKCRCIRVASFRETVRRQLQKEAFAWWPTAVAKLGVWAERVCVLVEFPAPDAEQWVMRCEALPAAAANAPKER